ncbi:uncharacterized protein BKA78DRAFT_4614 [Phyllosticta capitalensis]|uniref:uncharacterized protein n=1 Tax=Phyllosticta capitalensis TaxID=121624 RepID=UPI003131639B
MTTLCALEAEAEAEGAGARDATVPNRLRRVGRGRDGEAREAGRRSSGWPSNVRTGWERAGAEAARPRAFCLSMEGSLLDESMTMHVLVMTMCILSWSGRHDPESSCLACLLGSESGQMGLHRFTDSICYRDAYLVWLVRSRRRLFPFLKRAVMCSKATT